MTERELTADVAAAEARVAEVLAQLETGQVPDIEAEAERLPAGEPRATFRRLVQGVLAIRGVMPVQVRPGVVLGGRYRIREQLGSGGMGKVFRAHDASLDREVAVKVLAVLGTSGLDPVAQFRKEARLLARYTHPGIVAVHEVGTDGDVHYIVMDLVEGASLAELVASLRAERGLPVLAGELDPPEARRRAHVLASLPGGADAARPAAWPRCVARLLHGLSDSLAAAHAGDLVHRDVKPGNVLLRSDGGTVVLDFGLAGVRDEQPGAVTRGLFGSAAYLAPEQASAGEVGADPRTDVYQLGALLHELLVLQRAFDGRTATEILARIAQGDCRRPRQVDPGVPRELEAVCLKAMAREPAERYASAAELRDDLQRWLDGERPLAARGGVFVGVLHDLRRLVRRQRVAVLVGAALLVGLLLGLLNLGDEPVVGVRPLAWTPANDDFRFGDDVGSVYPGDALGARLQLREPRWVWAVSVWGPGSSPERLAPMLSRRVLEPEADDALWRSHVPEGVDLDADDPAILARSRFGLKLDAGEHVLLSTTIGAQAEPGSLEGLWVFTSPSREPALEDWFDALWERGQADDASGGVSLAAARALFDAPGGTPRGEPLAVDDEDLQRLGRLLTAAAVLGDEPWPDGALRRFEFLRRVAARAP